MVALDRRCIPLIALIAQKYPLLKASPIMALTIEEYATYLDTRDLTWPVPPEPNPPKARPHLTPLPGIRAVLWNVYGTLLCISEGELKFEIDNAFIMEVALEKTIHEFKMWNS